LNSWVIILAGGSGSRFDLDKPKQLWELEPGVTLLQKTISLFLSSSISRNILIVTRKEEENLVQKFGLPYCLAGNTRQESARLGLEALMSYKVKKVLIHDAARPFTPPELLEKVLQALDFYEAVDIALPLVDTIKSYDGTMLDRNNLYATQTPQGFIFPVILEKHAQAFHQKNNCYSDDIGLYLGQGGRHWTTIPGCPSNKKITYKNDLWTI